MASTSLLGYYQDNQIDPVPIPLQDDVAWQTHVAKRRNLYERHLGIPLSFLRDRSVLEFGCNSGENALVLAAAGANLTLMEPHLPAVERLEKLFSSFGLRERIVEVGHESIEDFAGDATYDLVIAEGFVNTLELRDQMLSKMCRLTAPGGLAVVSFDECVGYTLELVRKLVFWRAYRLEGLTDVRSAESLALAERIFSEDFGQLNASRAFVGWYDDVLVNPFVASDYLWSYQEMLPLIAREGCEFHATSPTWASVDRFTWYKNVLDSKDRHQQILAEWPEAFSFFLTGLPGNLGQTSPPSAEVVDSVTDLNVRVSNYFLDPDGDVSSVFYPDALDDYLSKSADPRIRLFNEEWKGVHLAASSNVAGDTIKAYQSTKSLRRTWGMPYHYLSIRKLG